MKETKDSIARRFPRFDAASDNRGFSLIEIIAVLVVMAILMALSINRLTLSNSELHTEADILKANLRFAQLRALTVNDNTATTWGIGLGGSTYTLQKNGVAALIPLPNDGSATHSLSSGVTVSGPTAVTYDYWGSPGNGNITITLAKAGKSASFTIAGKTGHIP